MGGWGAFESGRDVAVRIDSDLVSGALAAGIGCTLVEVGKHGKQIIRH